MRKEQFLEEFQGQTLSTAEMVDILGSRVAVSRFKNSGIISLIARGFYHVGSNFNPQEIGYRVISKYYKDKVIVSGMSALYLHGLTEQLMDIIEVDIVNNESSASFENELYVAKRVSRSRAIGIEKMTVGGEEIYVYSPERAIIDIIKGKSHIGSEYFDKAILMYREKYGFDKAKFSEFKEVFPNEVKRIISSFQLLETVDSPF